MIRIPESQIPLLPVKDIISGESIALGVVNEGVIIQFLERDECILIDWVDVVNFGIGLIKIKKDTKEPVEIEKPTGAG